MKQKMLKTLERALMASLCFCAAAHAQEAAVADYARAGLPSERVSAQYVTHGERWTGGAVYWYYNPANQPANLSTTDVLATIQTAQARWAQMCNITFYYLGLTSATRNMQGSSIDRMNVIGWQQFPQNLNGASGITYWNYSGQSMLDADITLNAYYAWTLFDVDAVMTHETGHMLGLQHSNVARSVMYATPYNTYSYERTLRGDDAAACTDLYGAAPNQLVNRTLNWAEASYASALQSGPAATQQSNTGYLYRYYAGSNSTASVKDGMAYYTAPDGSVHSMGPLSDFVDQVTADGF